MTTLPSLGEILEFLGDRVQVLHGPGDADLSAGQVPLSGAAVRGGLAFARGSGPQRAREVLASTASVILCEPELAVTLAHHCAIATLVAVDKPRLEFARIAARFLAERGDTAVNPLASVSPRAQLSSSVCVHAQAVIEAGARVGQGSVVGTGAFVGGMVNAGARVHIAAGAVLGAAGFGFERDDDGSLVRLPQYGGVVVGDDAEIGANSCIDRGAFGDTTIGEGTKLDDLCYVAHNASIGRHCLLMAGVHILGSAVIGDQVEISPGAVVRDHCSVGDGARIALGAVVVKDVPAGMTVAGVPARAFARRV